MSILIGGNPAESAVGTFKNVPPTHASGGSHTYTYTRSAGMMMERDKIMSYQLILPQTPTWMVHQHWDLTQFTLNFS